MDNPYNEFLNNINEIKEIIIDLTHKTSDFNKLLESLAIENPELFKFTEKEKLDLRIRVTKKISQITGYDIPPDCVIIKWK